MRPGDRVLDAACGTGDLALADLRAGAARVTGLDFSERMLERARRKEPRGRVGAGRPARAAVRRRRRSTPPRSASASATSPTSSSRCASCAACCAPGGRLAILEITQPRGLLRPFFSLWFDRIVPLLGKVLPGGAAYTYLPASVQPFPDAEALAELLRDAGFGEVAFRLLGGSIVALHTGVAAMTRAARASARRPASPATWPRSRPARARGRARARGSRRWWPARRSPPAASGCARCSASCRADGEPSVAAGVAVELVHMATLVHDDLVDGARLRRGLPAAWSVYGADAAKAAGDYLYACAFAVLAETGDERRREDARRRRALPRARRGDAEAADARPRHAGRRVPRALRPEDRQADRGRVPARLGRRRAARRVRPALGIAFQIADDILDCAGQTQETGKIPGTDLREGTPTMPLLLAARVDPVVREALAGGPLDGALVRVAATDAIALAGEQALDYAAKARSFLGAQRHRDELEILTYAVVDRPG